MTDVDETLWLCGDEDCGVGLHCRLCDRGGAPIAYYRVRLNNGQWHFVGDVETVDTITGLVAAGQRHLESH